MEFLSYIYTGMFRRRTGKHSDVKIFVDESFFGVPSSSNLSYRYLAK